MADLALKRKMLRALLERPGQRMSSWPFQDETVPNEDQYEAIEELIADAPRDVQAFDGSPHVDRQSDGTVIGYKPNNIRLTRSGIEWAREHLSKELGGSWQERSSDYLEALRAMDSGDRRRSAVPRAFDNGMAAVSRFLQMPGVRHVLSVFSFFGWRHRGPYPVDVEELLDRLRVACGQDHRGHQASAGGDFAVTVRWKRRGRYRSGEVRSVRSGRCSATLERRGFLAVRT